MLGGVSHPYFKKKGDKILIVFLFFCADAISQVNLSKNLLLYYSYIDSAEIAALSKNHSDASKYYNLAFEASEYPLIPDLINAFLVNNRKGNFSFDVSRTYLSKAIVLGLKKKNVRKIKKNSTKLSKKYFRGILKDYDSLHSVFLSDRKNELSNEIKEVIKRDKNSRNIFGLFSNFQKKDDENFKKLLEICHKHNWPNNTYMGNYAKNDKYDLGGRVSLVFLHFNPNQVDSLKAHLIKGLENGSIHPYEFARIMDYKEIKRNRVQIYGTYYFGKKKLFDLNDPDNLDNRRRAIGLEPIDNYLKKRDIKWQ